MFACMYVNSFTKPNYCIKVKGFFLLKDDVLDCLETQQEMRNEIKVCILGMPSKDPKYMAYVIPQTLPHRTAENILMGWMVICSKVSSAKKCMKLIFG